MKYKQKIQFIFYLEQVLQRALVFLLFYFEEVTSAREAKEGIDFIK